MLWYIVGTNLFFIVPAVHLYRLKYWDDLILTISIGVASFIYHGNWISSNPVAIRNVDVVLADWIVTHTAHYMLNFNRRWTFSIAALPVVIYTAEVDVIYRFIGMICYGLCTMAWVAYYHKKYLLHWNIVGGILITGELVCFAFGNKAVNYYNWLHGTHHILAFISQWCFMKSVPPPLPLLPQ